ncbi:MAG: filamentous hemagglutinin, partial [Verrucomicrobiaceae bacterium]|nr:filamentous hemagglutinin [Verrucomicrobiaceae bacterium]
MRFLLPSVALLACVSSLALKASGGDILRGGAGANQTPNGLRPQASTAGQVQARSNARDAMARTAQAISAVRAMQLAAKQAAQGRPNNLGADPNHPGQQLPNVPDGLGVGGLQVAPGAIAGSALWSGANLPVQ